MDREGVGREGAQLSKEVLTVSLINQTLHLSVLFAKKSIGMLGMAKNRDALISETRNDAISFYEDYIHLKSLVNSIETHPVNLRHASVILRRLLIENLLQKISSPRLGRVALHTIDNNPIYIEARRDTLISFVSGGASIHGIYIAAGMVNKGPAPLTIKDYHPEKFILLNLESFKKQRVIFTSEEWITREQIIKFVANVDHGVHAGKIREKWEERLSRFRHELSVNLETSTEGVPLTALSWKFGEAAENISFERYDPARINGVLIEILATIHFFISSPDILRLIEMIEKEVRD